MKVEDVILGSPSPNNPYGLRGRKATFDEEEGRGVSELRSCVEVEVDVQDSPFVIVLMVSVDVKKQWT